MKTIIAKESENDRIDAYIAKKEDISRVTVQRLIKEGKIKVNDKKTKPAYIVEKDDIISIEEEKPQEVELKPQNIPLDIIYEDEDIIVINKPKGMVVHPGNGNPEGTLANAVMQHCKGSLSGIGGKIRPGIVHRLDKDTSGLIVFAKNIKTKNYLQDNWDKVERRYLALVNGITKESDILKNYLKENQNYFVYVSNNGALAITEYKKIKEINNNSLLDINIKTGKKNQIRVQLSNIGHPILGDKKYGTNNYKRLCLHAYKLVLFDKEFISEVKF